MRWRKCGFSTKRYRLDEVDLFHYKRVVSISIKSCHRLRLTPDTIDLPTLDRYANNSLIVKQVHLIKAITLRTKTAFSPSHLVFRPQDVPDLVADLQAYHELLLEMPRKLIESMVLTWQGPKPKAIRAMQQFVGEGTWNDEVILKRHRREVEETLGEADNVLTLDGSDFLKQGKESVGVKRQSCGEVGKRAK